jgi:hypothetical protein
MKKTTFAVIMFASILVTTSIVYAIEKKPIAAVDTDSLVKETQISVPCGDSHVNVIWWIPFEFWQDLFINDKTTSESDKKTYINTLKPYSLLAICQADITTLAMFDFYSKDEVEKNLDIILKAKDGSLKRLIPLGKKDIDPNLQLILEIIKPILTAAMGNMGQNFHFFVLQDYDLTGTRQVDPYRFGILNFRIGQRSGKLMEAQIELPLNSLYVPRKCPNGKDAHVTWKYCPWTGEKLKD